MDTLQGHLLIAPPYLADPNFSQTVVLLIQHDAQGAFGVVLNRPTTRTIRELWQELRGAPCACSRRLDAGGPVSGPLVALHDESGLAEVRVADGVYCSMSASAIERLVERERERVRFYAGYSGWGAGQLEGELATGSWLTVEAGEDVVFDVPAGELWSHVVRRATDEALPPGLDAPPPAEDPSRN